MKRRDLILVFYALCNIQYSKSNDFTFSAFGSHTQIAPAAFGDFNSDELTDLFVISKDSRSVYILLGSSKEPYFASASPPLKCNHTHRITNVIPGDFDGDALMDILVTVRINDEPKADKTLVNVFIHWGVSTNGDNQIKCTDKILLTTSDEPLAITYRTDLRTDVFAVDRVSQNRSIFRFLKNGSKPEEIVLYPSTATTSKMKFPHSHAFLDLNEDNYADLILTTEHGCEIWTCNDQETIPRFINSTLGFRFPNNWKAHTNKENNIGQTLFLDLESNDKTYIILPVIRHPKDENTGSSIWVYSFESKVWYDLHVSFVDPEKKKWSFDYTGFDSPYTEIPTLRAGDFNNDGFVDLLATLKSGSMIKTFLLENSPCEEFCDYLKRTYKIQWSALSPNNENAVMGVFFDFMQDGILDVIFVQYNSKKNRYAVSAYKNSLDYDANFIKVMVISGIENSSVQMPVSSILGKKHFFGSNLPGPKIRYRTTNQDGKAQYGRTSQLAQSAHFALYLPYTIFGLGRTPNFVEDLVIGMFNETKQLSPIIPNSQLVIRIPDTAAKNPSKWRAQLFVTPSRIILQTVFALTGTCIVLVIIIGALHWKERREDKLERLQGAQRFHFDAM